MGGTPNPGRCSGPCDTTAIHGNYANYDSPSHPAAVYHRGELIKIIYQRNNHGPGGFVRLTLVPVDSMMNKKVHERNAFHFSCFGANPARATSADKKMRPHRFSLVGNDGLGRPHETGYYYKKVRIPECVPDGDYVLGWVWYGGTGGPVSNHPYTEPPFWKGYFGDYWSCSFVRVEGGKDLASKCDPVFENDMSKFSSDGCMSANDSPGVCIYEPCVTYAKYQLPKEFKDGAKPPPLTPAHFKGNPTSDRSGGRSGEAPPFEAPPNNPVTSEDMKRVVDAEVRSQIRSCKCINMAEKCQGYASQSAGDCLPRTNEQDQPASCKRACCDVCTKGYPEAADACIRRRVKEICFS